MELSAEEKELARKARNEYARKYRRDNPERVAEIKERYWLRKAEKMYAPKEKGE